MTCRARTGRVRASPRTRPSPPRDRGRRSRDGRRGRTGAATAAAIPSAPGASQTAGERLDTQAGAAYLTALHEIESHFHLVFDAFIDATRSLGHAPARAVARRPWCRRGRASRRAGDARRARHGDDRAITLAGRRRTSRLRGGVRGAPRASTPRMSLYRPESDLVRVNAHAARARRAGRRRALRLPRAGACAERATDGAFDVTVLPLLRAWGAYPGLAHARRAAAPTRSGGAVSSSTPRADGALPARRDGDRSRRHRQRLRARPRARGARRRRRRGARCSTSAAIWRSSAWARQPDGASPCAIPTDPEAALGVLALGRRPDRLDVGQLRARLRRRGLAHAQPHLRSSYRPRRCARASPSRSGRPTARPPTRCRPRCWSLGPDRAARVLAREPTVRRALRRRRRAATPHLCSRGRAAACLRAPSPRDPRDRERQSRRAPDGEDVASSLVVAADRVLLGRLARPAVAEDDPRIRAYQEQLDRMQKEMDDMRGRLRALEDERRAPATAAPAAPAPAAAPVAPRRHGGRTAGAGRRRAGPQDRRARDRGRAAQERARAAREQGAEERLRLRPGGVEGLPGRARPLDRRLRRVQLPEVRERPAGHGAINSICCASCSTPATSSATASC